LTRVRGRDHASDQAARSRRGFLQDAEARRRSVRPDADAAWLAAEEGQAMRRRRRSSSAYASAGPGLGLQTLTEMAHRNRSPFARWWRGNSHLAQFVYRIVFIVVGAAVLLVGAMIVGGFVIR
jgi:hypothetical protein